MRERDDLTPPPGQPADAAEKRSAERFASLVSSVIVGEALPPALDSEDRDLARVAGMIRASRAEVGLPGPRMRAVIDSVLTGLGENASEAEPSAMPAVQPPAPRSRRRAAASVSLMLVAAAALVVLGWPVASEPTPQSPVQDRPLAERQRSRPADAQVGMIARRDVADASRRIDAIYADRLDGYRSLALSPRGGRR